jgi:hypothetical protein
MSRLASFFLAKITFLFIGIELLYSPGHKTNLPWLMPMALQLSDHYHFENSLKTYALRTDYFNQVSRGVFLNK